MRTILSGPVTADHLSTAELFGIEPTSFVTNGATAPPADTGLPTDVFPVDVKLATLGGSARDFTLCQNADALICIGGNPHLVNIARQYGLAVFEG
jgi:hypothetical protein